MNVHGYILVLKSCTDVASLSINNMFYLYVCLCTDVFMYVGVLGFCTYVYTQVNMLSFVPVYIWACV